MSEQPDEATACVARIQRAMAESGFPVGVQVLIQAAISGCMGTIMESAGLIGSLYGHEVQPYPVLQLIKSSLVDYIDGASAASEAAAKDGAA